MTIFGMKLEMPTNKALFSALMYNVIVYAIGSIFCAYNVFDYKSLAFFCSGTVAGSLCSLVGVSYIKYKWKAFFTVIFVSISLGFTLQMIANLFAK